MKLRFILCRYHSAIIAYSIRPLLLLGINVNWVLAPKTSWRLLTLQKADLERPLAVEQISPRKRS